MAQVSAIGSGLEAVLPQAGTQSPARASGGEAFDTVLAKEIEGRSAAPEESAPPASPTGADATDQTSGPSFTETLDQAVNEVEGTESVEAPAEGTDTASRVDWEGLMWEILALVLGQGAQATQAAQGSEGAQGEAAALEGDTSSGQAATPGTILRQNVADWLASPEENAPPPVLAKILDDMGLNPSEVADFVKRIRAAFHAAAGNESQAAASASALEGLEGSTGQVAGIAESQAGGGPQTDSSAENAPGGTSAPSGAPSGTAAADGAKETASVSRSSAVHQVVETIRALPARAGTTEVRLQLVPESLGSVRVTLFVDDQSVRATFVTDNPLSRAVLEAG
ncbi:MAG: flagellar hook-length control protein FliK, partial [Nitrospirae bacterium]|nr:flagellar hook-length control protein FliK [Nitrospirota bacterium]